MPLRGIFIYKKRPLQLRGLVFHVVHHLLTAINAFSNLI